MPGSCGGLLPVPDGGKDHGKRLVKLVVKWFGCGFWLYARRGLKMLINEIPLKFFLSST